MHKTDYYTVRCDYTSFTLPLCSEETKSYSSDASSRKQHVCESLPFCCLGHRMTWLSFLHTEQPVHRRTEARGNIAVL